jgi:hypothetical protein
MPHGRPPTWAWIFRSSRISSPSIASATCLYGFTRFEAAPTSAVGDIEDVQLAVRGAPIGGNADWLPAVEQFDEGLFIHFDERAIAEWLRREARLPPGT